VTLILPSRQVILPDRWGAKHRPLLEDALQLGEDAAHRLMQKDELSDWPSFSTQIRELNRLSRRQHERKLLVRAVFLGQLKRTLARMFKEAQTHREASLRKLFEPLGRSYPVGVVASPRQLDALKRNELYAGAMHQHLLTRIFLSFDLSAEREVIGLYEHVQGMERNWWVRRCIGAAGVARIARTAIQQGGEVFLPTTWEDVHRGVDLFIRAKDDPDTYCISIKVRARVDGARIFVDRSFPSQGNSVSDKRRRFFFKRVHQLRALRQGTYIPVVAELSSALHDVKRDRHLIWLTNLLQRGHPASAEHDIAADAA